jgi:hypothetical protein
VKLSRAEKDFIKAVENRNRLERKALEESKEELRRMGPSNPVYLSSVKELRLIP